jgi:hypothetical protein
LATSSDLLLALVRPKLNHNLRIGARYTFQTSKKEEITIPIKAKKYSKATWGIGGAINISPYLPTDYEDVVLEDGYDQWNIKPFLSIHKLSNENKKLQEFYFSNFTLAKENSQENNAFIENGVIKYQYYPIQERYLRFILGYAYYKKVEKMSKGVFNFYYGTRLEYAINDYKKTPTTAVGYQQSNQHHGLRLSFATTMLWNVSKKWQIETKLTPITFLSVSRDFEKNTSYPSDFPKHSGVWENNNSSSLNLFPVLQLGVKYHIKTVKTKL